MNVSIKINPGTIKIKVKNHHIQELYRCCYNVANSTYNDIDEKIAQLLAINLINKLHDRVNDKKLTLKFTLQEAYIFFNLRLMIVENFDMDNYSEYDFYVSRNVMQELINLIHKEMIAPEIDEKWRM